MSNRRRITALLRKTTALLRKPRVAVPLALLLFVVFGGYLYWWWNAVFFPLGADPFDVDAFGTVEINADENAFVDYKQAARMLVFFPAPTGAMNGVKRHGQDVPI